MTLPCAQLATDPLKEAQIVLELMEEILRRVLGTWTSTIIV